MRIAMKLVAGLAAVTALAVIAVGDRPKVEFLNSNPASTLPFSEAVRVDNLLFLSGQIGVVPGSLALAEGGMRAEAQQTMDNIRATLEAHGLSMAHVVKCTVMLADMARWAEFNEVYVRYFERPYPARSAFGASGLALGAQVEVECVAAIER